MLRKRSIAALAVACAAFALTGTATSSASTPTGTGAQVATISTAVPPAADGPVVSTALRPGTDSGRSGTRIEAGGCWYASSHWWCNNASGAGVYINNNGQAQYVGTMYSNPSWFTCRSDDGGYVGGPHPYRWEWTQADNGAWGWMKDTDISSETDPLPVC
ncbi:hypothetical protein ACFYZ9_39120 [Streptomyces sp. NPDC001691]|uniref:hypothetical protein n=1 Tax=Streptomyces sp. NPDC001691 TaxID=3364600 RepID=UPI0036B75D2A